MAMTLRLTDDEQAELASALPQRASRCRKPPNTPSHEYVAHGAHRDRVAAAERQITRYSTLTLSGALASD